ncbi:unnamed protein product [Didymodactylos carnosus]|uniref:Uncharacterized protein n=1 Tax=Didymodactylos carnosus TaxID=1234261 RepID=A0A813XV46_9BILA|nr:unnamed protein product [Didymodactylos carnosus]CAF0883149.1 unnamed protein product [Didymodactylos carnosus]CAF3662133.1 unnamed protein product [Didymodactylos carnosus]CAF3666580.1 unnamed protein product [Didymodactylos carnosus]
MEIAMDDTTSLSSLNSADFILIGKEPKLQVAAGGGSTDLEKNMAEILNESTDSSQFEKTLVVTPPTSLPSSPDDTAQNSGDNNTTPIGSMNDSNQFEEHQKKLNEHEINIDNNDDTSSIASSTAGDLTRPIQNARPYLGNSVLFHGVTYLGSASINAPRSEEELNRNMAILNEQSKMSIEVTLCVPDSAEGLVRKKPIR